MLAAAVRAGPAEPRSRLPGGAPGELPGAQAPPGHIPRSRRSAAGCPDTQTGKGVCAGPGLLRFLPGVWRGAACLRPADNERGPGARTRLPAAWAARGACPGPAHPLAPNEASVLRSTAEPGPAPAGKDGAPGGTGLDSPTGRRGLAGERGGCSGDAGRRGACCRCGLRAERGRDPAHGGTGLSKLWAGWCSHPGSSG